MKTVPFESQSANLSLQRLPVHKIQLQGKKDSHPVILQVISQDSYDLNACKIQNANTTCHAFGGIDRQEDLTVTQYKFNILLL